MTGLGLALGTADGEADGLALGSSDWRWGSAMASETPMGPGWRSATEMEMGGDGVGEADGDGLALGDGEALGEGDGLGAGEGLGLGDGLGLGLGRRARSAASGGWVLLVQLLPLAPLVVPSGQVVEAPKVVALKVAPAKFAPVRSAPSKVASVTLAPAKFAQMGGTVEGDGGQVSAGEVGGRCAVEVRARLKSTPARPWPL